MRDPDRLVVIGLPFSLLITTTLRYIRSSRKKSQRYTPLQIQGPTMDNGATDEFRRTLRDMRIACGFTQPALPERSTSPAR
jgi:hypothetical protein